MLKPIVLGASGPAVEDVQQRLQQLGYSLGDSQADGVFGEDTATAVRQFREDERLTPGESVDDECWSALVDATFSLGDRSIYLRLPYFHGADIQELQTALNVLGFVCGDMDGIFGAHTERALREFQANVGIDPDGIAGSLTFNAIARLEHVWRDKDATPHSAATTGFSRAAEVLERVELCVFGTETIACEIASRISNLAKATTPESLVTSADSIEGIPSQTMLLIKILIEPEVEEKGVPVVVFSDDPGLSARVKTAADSATTKPPRIDIRVPESCFVSISDPTVREQQHVAVTLLDAICTAFSTGR